MRARVGELPVPCTTIPHFLGKEWRTMREAEDRLVGMIGDENSVQHATTFFVGPQANMEILKNGSVTGL